MPTVAWLNGFFPPFFPVKSIPQSLRNMHRNIGYSNVWSSVKKIKISTITLNYVDFVHLFYVLKCT